MTERRRVEESLRESEERFRLLVESVRDYAIFMLDPTGRIATWNIGAERIKGYRADEIIGEHLSRFYPTVDIEAGKCEMELEVAAREGRFEDEGWRLRKDGSHFWANVILTALRDADGRLVGYAKVTRDLTERKRAEEERLRLGILARERIATLTHLSEALAGALSTDEVSAVVVEAGTTLARADACLLYMLDPRSLVLELLAERGCNPNLVDRIRHITPESDNPVYSIGVGRVDSVWIESAAEYDAFFPAMARVEADGPRTNAFWCASLRAEGRTIGMLAVAFHAPRAFASEEREFVGTFARQCAQALARAGRLAAERAAASMAEEARRSADRANHAKDEFLAVVSHELRTPLNAIMGWAKIMMSRDFDDRRRRVAVETIERNAGAMAQLIEDLLDMSRVISGKMRLELQVVDVASVVEAAVHSIKPAADAKEVTVACALEVSPRVTADPTRLQQIVWNLVSNAIKFTPRAGRVHVRLRRDSDEIALTVEDTGKGISPAFLPSVFDAFRQEDASPSRARGGLGLGLAITRQLVELHGGRIEAFSEGEGQGSKFVVTLPLPSGAQAAEAAPTALAKDLRENPFERPAQLRGLRVIVVEDDDDGRELVAMVLEDCGCRVTTARSVAEAMTAIGKEVPDVLLSDIAMPGEDGYDLIRRVRALPADAGGSIPAGALTAFARPEDRRKILNAGYSIHLPKPIEPAELVAVVATLSRSASPRQI